jgi:hypothetical protein
MNHRIVCYSRTSRPGLSPCPHQAARAGTSICAILEDRGPRDEGRAVAVDTLHEPAATGRQVVHAGVRSGGS